MYVWVQNKILFSWLYVFMYVKRCYYLSVCMYEILKFIPKITSEHNDCMYVCMEMRARHTYIPSHYLMPSYLWKPRIRADRSETLNEK